MLKSSEPITKTVKIEVPPEVEAQVREQADGDEDIEMYLLDEFLFEYEWLFVGEMEE